MPFDPSVITAIRSYADGPGLVIAWDSTAPAGTHYQVYIRGALAWAGQARRATVARWAGPARVDVGAVLPAEAESDLSAQLPDLPAAGAGDRVRLDWTGGTGLGADLAGFRIYGSTNSHRAPLVTGGLGGNGARRSLVTGGNRSAPAGIDYSTPLADLPAFPAAAPVDSRAYRWTSGRLAAGRWGFAVVPYDVAGNEGAAATAAATVEAPPAPPGWDVDRQSRAPLYSLDPSTRVATLSWLPSPDA